MHPISFLALLATQKTRPRVNQTWSLTFKLATRNFLLKRNAWNLNHLSVAFVSGAFDNEVLKSINTLPGRLLKSREKKVGSRCQLRQQLKMITGDSLTHHKTQFEWKHRLCREVNVWKIDFCALAIDSSSLCFSLLTHRGGALAHRHDKTKRRKRP